MSDETVQTPQALVETFNIGIRGQGDIDVGDVVHDIIADIIDSFRLAGVTDEQLATVQDYVVNHYGDL